MLITIANQAFLGWTYFKPEFYVRGLVDGNGRMLEHRKGLNTWWDMTTLKFFDRSVIFLYCGSTSKHMYLKGSYDYFYSRTWPFKTHPIYDEPEPIVQNDIPHEIDPALPPPTYEWSSQVTSDINTH